MDGSARLTGRAGLGPWAAGQRPDKKLERPPQVIHALGEVPPFGQAAALAAQQIAIQSIYLILPGVVGAQFGLVPIDLVNFLQLSVAAIAIAALVQVLVRGPVGSGYPVPSIPSPVFVAVYLLAAPGANLVVMGTMTAVAGLLGILLSLLLRRLQAIVPTEVAGVVVFLIGISLLPRAFAAIAGDSEDAQGRGPLALATLGLMIAVALIGGRFSRYAVLVGAAAGCVAAFALGIGVHADTRILASAPWFALPLPEPPAASAFDASLLPAFGIALLASFASWTGDLVAFQRAADGGWRRPDTPPIRRGLLAQSLALVAAGGMGGMAPSTSSACVGLAIATRTLARRVAVVGSVALLVLACCPKLLALFVLLPDPVEAAMLGYVCCFMLASGCGLMTSRMLDLRRTFTVGIGIALGIGALLGLPVFSRGVLQMLGSPVTAGAAAAILLNLVTAPLVARRAVFDLRLGAGTPREVDDRMEALGGAWGARRETMGRAGHALLEVAEVLAARGVGELRVAARHAFDSVQLSIAWQGAGLPQPSAHPDAADLEGPIAAQEAFALWLATRQAETVEQRAGQGGCELRLSFPD
jgi:xanthine permease XanP